MWSRPSSVPRVGLLLGALALGGWRCHPAESATAHAADGEAEAGAPPSAEAPIPQGLATVSSVPVVGPEGPGGRPFAVALRTPELQHYPCGSCHAGPAVTEEGSGDVHRSLQPEHPAETGAQCATCHVASNVERLRLLRGETTSMDHAYRICAQCHFTQVEAWAGGAHGKRVGGWSGERIVRNCTGCHDPHRPAFPQRRPEPGPQVPRTGGRW